MSGLKVLIGYPYFASDVYPDVQELELAYHRRLRGAGFDVEGYCLTLNPPGPRLSFGDLDSLWRRGDKALLGMYERLEEKLSNKHVFINECGINLHPEFVEQLPVFTVYQCFDDPESSSDLSEPVARAYDLCFVGNIAEVERYRSWGVKHVEWMPLGLMPEIYDPTLTYDEILNGERDVDLFMLCDRLNPRRKPRLDRLLSAFPEAHFYGRGWPRGILPHEKQLLYFRRAKIGPNVHNSTGPVNYRTFYLPANGIMQICDNKNHLKKIFTLGKEVVGFEAVPECIDLCRYYLVHDQERREIAAEGWRRAVTDYNEIAVFSRKIGMVQNYISSRLRTPMFAPRIAVQQRRKALGARVAYALLAGIKMAIPGPMKAILRRFLGDSPQLGKGGWCAGLKRWRARRKLRLEKGHLKLHLGCGTVHLDGYVNIDCDSNAKPDLHLDFRFLDQLFKPESVVEVIMIHSLSHLNLWQARDFFVQLYTLLEPGGRLIIEVPDIINCARKVLEVGGSLLDYLEGVRGFYAFGMDQIARREAYKPYAFGWSGWHLKEELERAGFKVVHVLEPQTHGPSPWRDIRIEATK